MLLVIIKMCEVLSIDHGSCYVEFKFNDNYKINVKISEIANCCEVFGLYIMCNEKSVDDIDKYVGKELVNLDMIFNYDNFNFDVVQKNIDKINKEISFDLKDKVMSHNPIFRLYFRGDKYPLDIILYNEHNGYYSHDCYVEIDIVINEYLLKYDSLYSI